MYVFFSCFLISAIILSTFINFYKTLAQPKDKTVLFINTAFYYLDIL